MVFFCQKYDKIQKRTRPEQAGELQPELNMLISQRFLDSSNMCLVLEGNILHISPVFILQAVLRGVFVPVLANLTHLKP